MTILSNRRAAGDLSGKVIICKRKYHDYSHGAKEWQAGDLVIVLSHTKKKTGAKWNPTLETLKFFSGGAPGSVDIGPDFDMNWGIIEPEDRLKGASFVFTGALQNTREYYKKIVEMFGGEFSSSISSKTSYLVLADPASMSTKAQKARANGTNLLDERAFLNLIQKGL